ncbi:MAG: autotransporter-associated beta strand repeat-containing protein [Pirellulales bacterium]|nr:autotransporter-associated beta strand repeat-containing protein [Pirellulales bacterium]
MLGAIAAPLYAEAVTANWTNGVGDRDFTAAGNWDAARDGVSADTLNVNLTETASPILSTASVDVAALYVGTAAPGGTLTVQSGGSVSLVENGPVQIGAAAGVTGNLTMTGGTLTSPYSTTAESVMRCGYNGGTGFMTLTGDAALNRGTPEYNIANNGKGALTFGDGTGSSGTLIVGQVSTDNPYLKVGGNITLGNGPGTTGVTGGTADATLHYGTVEDSKIYLGWAGGSGTYTQTGGTTNCIKHTYLGDGVSGVTNTATLNLEGGVYKTTYIRVYDNAQSGLTATINFDGGTLRAQPTRSGDSAANFIGINGSGTAGTFNVYIKEGGATIESLDDAEYPEHPTTIYHRTINVPLQHGGTDPIDGGLTKGGHGDLTLTGANTYTGPTNIVDGTLVLGASVTIANSSLVDVLSGASFDVSAKTAYDLVASQTLAGDGTVVGSVVAAAGSTLEPGHNGIGTLTLTGDLTLDDGALLGYELGPVAGSDAVSMAASTLTLNGQEFSDFTFTPAAGFEAGVYTLIDAGTVSGSLSSNPSALTGMVGGCSATLSVEGDNLVLTVVPEPSMFILMALAGLALAAFRRCRN